MAFSKFEDIEAWQEARELNKLICAVCKRPHVEKDKNWCDQISRSIHSAMSNIAEGNGAQSDVEFAKFLGYAKRSITETRSHLYYALDKNYISKEEFADFKDRANKIASQLTRLIDYLYKSNRKRRHILKTLDV